MEFVGPNKGQEQQVLLISLQKYRALLDTVCVLVGVCRLSCGISSEKINHHLQHPSMQKLHQSFIVRSGSGISMHLCIRPDLAVMVEKIAA